MQANLNARNMLFDYQVPPTIEELSCDWFKYEWMLVNTILNDIIENAGNKEFCIEYVWECEAKLRAKYHLPTQQNNSPPDSRWMRKFCREYLEKLGPNKYTWKKWIWTQGWCVRSTHTYVGAQLW